ncbi:hypothetical protein [Deinococcus hopiensis]|uniref:Uncharacterized protein n=1 Tax=Deinococcus hopiensis KR-140 TaxID=695939 RepID=A0A1W1V776_9DEIO|nr:hypothetical protein [Deinococcus hopiensis]SMB89212.1 hypothetical protein SAMN00790413_00313 [Deinococcus hopiensis KR-140]
MTAPPVPTFGLDNGRPLVFGLPSGRYELVSSTGAFPLPAFIAQEDESLESGDALHQAPASPGGVRAGFGMWKPLVLNFGTEAASINGLLEFGTEALAVAWKRAFLAAARNSLPFQRIRDTVTSEEYDGWVSKAVVKRQRLGSLLKLSFTFSALDSHAWLSTLRVINGNPAVCPNGAAEPAYPYITCTATGPVVTISDGTRTLTINTTAGHVITADSGRADGETKDNGELADVRGRYPRIAPGGSTITVTGASGVQVRYREPAFGTPDIEPPEGAGLVWQEKEW